MYVLIYHASPGQYKILGYSYNENNLLTHKNILISNLLRQSPWISERDKNRIASQYYIEKIEEIGEENG